MNIFFTSDTHFGHSNIAGPTVSNWKSGYRNFKSVEEMDETLIKNWNGRVKSNDLVYHLGDFAFSSPVKAIPIKQRLNGKVHLILGNHDKTVLNMQQYFENISSYREIYVDGKQQLVLFHYPIESWNNMRHGSWMIHGHCHYSLPVSEGRKIDIGVDNPLTNYAPMEYSELKAIMAKKENLKIDHHG